MGLDGVELVMALEEEFGVELINDDLSKVVTPRLVGDLIYSKLQHADERACQTQRAFYILRRALMKRFGLKREAVTLDLRLSEVMPREQEKDAWPSLKEAVDARSWPTLERPQWECRMRLALAALALPGSAALGAWSGAGWGAGLCGGFLLLIPAVAVEQRVTRSLKRYVPARFRTVRDLVPLVRTSDGIKWTRGEVSALVKQIVMEQLGVSEEKYAEDAHFIDDFGMD